MKKKEKTLAGMFTAYVAVFCITTVLLAAASFLLLLVMSGTGCILPANYAEKQLEEREEKIQEAEREEVAGLIPQGCSYGVYDGTGVWQEGDFSVQERRDAWEQYEKSSIYAADGRYYRLIAMDDGGVCIVKYDLRMRYASERLNEILPAPELLLPILDVVLFLLNLIFLSKRFAGKIKAQLEGLSRITEKIAANDLEFQTEPSAIREIGEVMDSLERMKNALQDSLEKQWDMEKQKQMQLSALAHDVKTPLTVIRGNAELLEESGLPEEDRKCAAYVLANVKEIERYLERMRQVLGGTDGDEEEQTLPCEELERMFRETAEQICSAEKLPVSFDIRPTAGEICCHAEGLLRAWTNLVSNGAEHTDCEKGLRILMGQESRKGQSYLAVTVRDYGPGFSERDLQYAAQEFYSGDTSRHGRSHQGLGLSIARRFLEAQGGFLEYKNWEAGAEAALWVKIETGGGDA